MKRTVTAVLFIVAIGIPALKAEQVDVTYLSGTIKGITGQAAAKLDTTTPTALELAIGVSHIAIPYAAISACDYREENRFRLGVLPAIAIGALKARSKRHLLTITWNDEAGTAQTVTFEMTKDRARGVIKVLDARAPQTSTTALPWRSRR